MSDRRIYPDELCHHGILGMKWGKRNGPPYPLDAKDHSASEKKAGYRNSIQKRSFSLAYTLKHPVKVLRSSNATATDKKTAISSIAASAALTAGAAYAMPKLIRKGSGYAYKVMNKASKAARETTESGPTIVDKFGNVVTDPEILKKMGLL